MHKVKGKEGLYRDPHTGAVINADDNAFRQAKLAKKRILEEREQRQRLETRMSQLEELVQYLMNKD